jgi:hypothetical protein
MIGRAGDNGFWPAVEGAPGILCSRPAVAGQPGGWQDSPDKQRFHAITVEQRRVLSVDAAMREMVMTDGQWWRGAVIY